MNTRQKHPTNSGTSPEESKVSRNIIHSFLKYSHSPDIIFWLIYSIILFISSQRFMEESNLTGVLIRESIKLIFLIVALILNNRILVPQFLKKNRGFVYAMMLAILLLVSSYGDVSVLMRLNTAFPNLKLYNHPYSRFDFLFNAIPLLFFTMLNMFLRIFKEWSSMQELQARYQEAKRENLNAQLEKLKAQVNPHFLFNTLNNIYSLSLFNDKETPGMILKLSDLLSYMIYDCREDMVDIEKEAEFMINYAALEKMRFNENVKLTMDIETNWNGNKISPLLFAPLLENAFKHGVNIRQDNPYIHIEFCHHDNGQLYFLCENLTDSKEKDESGGIGLINVKKRLELLYPDRYELKIDHQSDKFKVTLTLDIGEGPDL